MKLSREFVGTLTEFICTSLYVYNHAKNGGKSLSPEEITEKAIKEFTGMDDYLDFKPTYPLLQNYTQSMVGIIIKSIEDIDSHKAIDIKQISLLSEIKEYLIAASDGSMSRNNSEALAAELLEKLK
jgi:hypothetical protein